VNEEVPLELAEFIGDRLGWLDIFVSVCLCVAAQCTQAELRDGFVGWLAGQPHVEL
jgi:hypothetical protein